MIAIIYYYENGFAHHEYGIVGNTVLISNNEQFIRDKTEKYLKMIEKKYSNFNENRNVHIILQFINNESEVFGVNYFDFITKGIFVNKIDLLKQKIIGRASNITFSNDDEIDKIYFNIIDDNRSVDSYQSVSITNSGTLLQTDEKSHVTSYKCIINTITRFA